MSTSESWDVNRHTARCTGPVSVVVLQCKLVSDWRLSKQRSPPPYGRCGSGKTLYVFKLLVTMFTVLSSWQCTATARVHPVHLTNVARSTRWPPTFGPSQSGWANRSASIGSCQYRHLLLLLSSKAGTHSTTPRRVEGWVDLAGWLHTEMVYLPAPTVSRPSK